MVDPRLEIEVLADGEQHIALGFFGPLVHLSPLDVDPLLQKHRVIQIVPEDVGFAITVGVVDAAIVGSLALLL